MKLIILLSFFISIVPVLGQAEDSAKSTSRGTSKKISRKTQEVNFEGADIDGVARTPDGAYMLQKRGIKFMPLYRVEKQFDRDIRDSIEYLR
jgi:hypothetical protein